MDYIVGGCEIGVHVAIDFTASNGYPTSPSSLHYINQATQSNSYTQAIAAVLEILENYDSDKMFPVYGFGGILPDSRQVSHCFALNGDIYNPECNGIKGVMRSYFNAINKVTLRGGTHFNEIIKFVNDFTKS